MSNNDSRKSIPHRRRTYRACDLVQGFKGDRIDFSYRPYEERSAEAQADYDALHQDLLARGMLNPLITFKGHILIGMRRFEIMRELGQSEFPCIEVLEDVSKWWRDDLPRLEALKTMYGMGGA